MKRAQHAVRDVEVRVHLQLGHLAGELQKRFRVHRVAVGWVSVVFLLFLLLRLHVGDRRSGTTALGTQGRRVFRKGRRRAKKLPDRPASASVPWRRRRRRIARDNYSTVPGRVFRCKNKTTTSGATAGQRTRAKMSRTRPFAVRQSKRTSSSIINNNDSRRQSDAKTGRRDATTYVGDVILRFTFWFATRRSPPRPCVRPSVERLRRDLCVLSRRFAPFAVRTTYWVLNRQTNTGPAE